MLLKFKTSLAGAIVIKLGEIVDLPKAEALRHIEGGNAVEADVIETATFKAREKALSEQRSAIEKETARAGKETR